MKPQPPSDIAKATISVIRFMISTRPDCRRGRGLDRCIAGRAAVHYFAGTSEDIVRMVAIPFDKIHDYPRDQTDKPATQGVGRDIWEPVMDKLKRRDARKRDQMDKRHLEPL